jgi:phage terminase small subunit
VSKCVRIPPAILTPKQQRFVAEYLIDLNATQAAIRAGYSKKTAQRIGSENLSKPLIATGIRKAIEERRQRTQIDADYVLVKAVALLETSIADFLAIPENGKMPYFDLSKATREQLAAIETLQLDTTVDSGIDGMEVQVNKIKLGIPNKKQLLELIGKHINVNAFKETIEHQCKNGAPIDTVWRIEVMK